MINPASRIACEKTAPDAPVNNVRSRSKNAAPVLIFVMTRTVTVRKGRANLSREREKPRMGDAGLLNLIPCEWGIR